MMHRSNTPETPDRKKRRGHRSFDACCSGQLVSSHGFASRARSRTRSEGRTARDRGPLLPGIEKAGCQRSALARTHSASNDVARPKAIDHSPAGARPRCIQPCATSSFPVLPQDALLPVPSLRGRPCPPASAIAFSPSCADIAGGALLSARGPEPSRAERRNLTRSATRSLPRGP